MAVTIYDSTQRSLQEPKRHNILCVYSYALMEISTHKTITRSLYKGKED